jgi:protein TonB
MRSFMTQAVVVSVLAHGALGLAWTMDEGPERPAPTGPLQVSLLAPPPAMAPALPARDARTEPEPEPRAPKPMEPERAAESPPAPAPAPPAEPAGATPPTPEPPASVDLPRSPSPQVAVATSEPAHPAAMPELDVSVELERQYKAALREAIARERRYPRLSRRLGQEGVVEVQFEVLRDGRIQGVAVAEGSGYAPLDRAAVAAVERVGRFEPIPEALAKERWPLVIALDYRL